MTITSTRAPHPAAMPITIWSLSGKKE